MSTTMRISMKRSVKNVLRIGLAVVLVSSAAACASPEQKVEKYAKSGYAYLEKGETGKANVQFRNALKINDRYVPALMGVAKLSEKKQDFQNLFAVLQQVVQIDPNNVEARTKLGKLYLIGKDTEHALEQAEAALKLDHDNVDATVVEAAAYFSLGDKTRAIDLARKALSKDPKNAEAAAVIASDKARSGDIDGAIAEIDKVLTLDDKAVALHILKLQFLDGAGRRDAANAELAKMTRLFPDVAPFKQAFARELYREKKFPEARAELVAIAKLSPNRVEPILAVAELDKQTGGTAAARATFKAYADAAPKNIEIKFAYGQYLRALGEDAAATAAFEELAKNKDKAVALRARNEIATQKLVEHKPEEAEKIVEEILAKDSRNTDALIKRAGLRIDAKKYDDAIADLRTALADKPDSAPAMVLMAAAFERKGDIDFAKSELAQAVQQSKSEPKTVAAYVGLLLRTNDVKTARDALDAALKIHANDSALLKLLATTQLMQQDWEGAEATAKLLESRNSADPETGRLLSAAFLGQKDYAGVIDVLGAENQRQSLTGQPLAALVGAYVAQKRVGDAEDVLRGMIERNPKIYDARVLLGQLLVSEKKDADAETALRAAYAVDAARGEAVRGLFDLLRRTKRTDEIVPFLDDVIRTAPDNLTARYLKGDQLLSVGDKAGALVVYDGILARRPNEPIAANNYASIVADTRTDKASLARALERAKPFADTQNVYFLDTLGWVQFKNGDAVSAAATLEKAVAGADGFADAHFHLAQVYLAQGDTARGQSELKKALDASPSPEIAAQARGLLSSK